MKTLKIENIECCRTLTLAEKVPVPVSAPGQSGKESYYSVVPEFTLCS
jgi:hypothetical protein